MSTSLPKGISFLFGLLVSGWKWIVREVSDFVHYDSDLFLYLAGNGMAAVAIGLTMKVDMRVAMFMFAAVLTLSMREWVLYNTEV